MYHNAVTQKNLDSEIFTSTMSPILQHWYSYDLYFNDISEWL